LAIIHGDSLSLLGSFCVDTIEPNEISAQFNYFFQIISKLALGRHVNGRLKHVINLPHWVLLDYEMTISGRASFVPVNLKGKIA